MMADVDTALIPFSAGYQYTEFYVRRYHGDRVRVSIHRDEDMRAWRRGEYDRGLPVVLRMDDSEGARHVVPMKDTDVDYEELRVPDYWPMEYDGIVSALIPSEAHTRQLIGGDNGT